MYGPYLSEATSTTVHISIKIRTTCEGTAVDGRYKHKPELSCHACFNLSRICSGSLTLHSDSSPPLV